MNLLIKIILCISLILSIVIPFIAFMLSQKKKTNYIKALIANVTFFFGLIILSSILFFNMTSFANANEVNSNISGIALGLAYLAAGLSVGLSCVGGGIAVSAAASAALGAISEDSSILGKSLIFVGLAEGVCLYGLIISFMILGKL